MNLLLFAINIIIINEIQQENWHYTEAFISCVQKEKKAHRMLNKGYYDPFKPALYDHLYTWLYF